MPAPVQRGRDEAGPEPVAGVEVEDRADDHGLARIGHEGLGGAVDLVAEGAASAFPFPAGGFAFHSGDDAFDDGVALELGEHREQLQQHAAHRSGGVEGFGRGAEHDSGGVEFFEEGDGVAEAAGEPVDAVDEQDVDGSCAGGGEGVLQAGAGGGGAGDVVVEAGDQAPSGLAGDVGGELGVLGFLL